MYYDYIEMYVHLLYRINSLYSIYFVFVYICMVYMVYVFCSVYLHNVIV